MTSNAPNRQDKNVGNYGDILKHAALVQLAHYLASCPRTLSYYYIDTHTYLHHAKLANLDWFKQISWLEHRYPQYVRYRNAEQSWLDRGEYLCSVGLVTQLCPHAVFYCYEHRPDTQTRLRLQLDAAKLKSESVGGQFNADVWLNGVRHQLSQQSLVLMLVDPFQMTNEQVSLTERFLSKLEQSKSQYICVLFDYQQAERVKWNLHTRLNADCMTIDFQPFHLACVFSATLSDAVVRELTPLGWKIHEPRPQ